MNFLSSLCRNWIFAAIIVGSLSPVCDSPAADWTSSSPVAGRTTSAAASEPKCPGTRTGRTAAATCSAQLSPIVRQIEIQYAGPATLSRQRILSNMKTTVGQPYSEQTVEDDVRSLYATGLVTNVRIYGEPLPDGVKVIVVVQTRVTLTEVVIQGNQIIKAKRIRRELNLKTGSPLDEQALERPGKRWSSCTRSAVIPTPMFSTRWTSTRIGELREVTFAISEGQKSVVKTIRFVGNTALTSKRLRKEMKTKQNNLLGFVTGAGRLNNQQLDGDVQKIKELYPG